MLIYARYSTEEQNPRSIDAQVRYCKSILRDLDITGVKTDVLSDREMSGELIFRPGIDEVRSGIEEGLWDLILVEDASRLFRAEAPCLELVGLAVDQQIRRRWRIWDAVDER